MLIQQEFCSHTIFIGGGWEGPLGGYVSALLLEPLLEPVKNKRELLTSPREQGKHVLTSM